MPHDEGRNHGVLLLAHQGGALIDGLIMAAKACGVDTYVVTSMTPAKAVRLEGLHASCTRLFVGTEPAVSWDDIEAALASLAKDGIRPLACLTAWDGYRRLMVRANALLGGNDLDMEAVDGAQDKLLMRQTLFSAGLSRARSFVVDSAESLAAVQKVDAPLFLKPRKGLGSFAASRLDPKMTWDEFESIRRTLTKDPDSAGVFVEGASFVAEDFIEGQEMSVEVIAHEGRVFPMAIHEYGQVVERDGTVWVVIMYSPPQSLAVSQRRPLVAHLDEIFARFRLRAGCFHVELRATSLPALSGGAGRAGVGESSTARWEVIEINTRVGGLYVAQSVEAATGENILELWLRTLLPHLDGHDLRHRLNACRERFLAAQEKVGTFFRGYHGLPGRQVESIRWNPEVLEPVQRFLLATPGMHLARLNREIVIGQAFWTFPLDGAEQTAFERLSKESAAALEVVYAPTQ